jgi:hypothetical protein
VTPDSDEKDVPRLPARQPTMMERMVFISEVVQCLWLSSHDFTNERTTYLSHGVSSAWIREVVHFIEAIADPSANRVPEPAKRHSPSS